MKNNSKRNLALASLLALLVPFQAYSWSFPTFNMGSVTQTLWESVKKHPIATVSAVAIISAVGWVCNELRKEFRHTPPRKYTDEQIKGAVKKRDAKKNKQSNDNISYEESMNNLKTMFEMLDSAQQEKKS